jgi:inorganic triphosphatase YgiF
MHHEVELKLGLLPEQLDRFQRHGLLRSLAQGRAQTHHLVTTYFDTDKLALQANGAALRVRKTDGKDCLQTLKVRAAYDGRRTAKAYLEYEAALDGDQPDLSRIENAEANALLADPDLARKLKPVFITDITRRILPVRMVDAEIEVALDVGEVRSGNAVMKICEAELELIKGHPARLTELALALHESLPVRLEQRTKAARGYGLATGIRPVPVKSRPLNLKRSDTVAEAIPAIMRDCLAHMLANEPAVLDGTNPEGVHQMRVGLRRLRAILGLVRPLLDEDVTEYLRDELRWLQAQLGPARDWDVFIAETLDRLAAHRGAQNGIGRTLRLADEARSEAYARARAAVVDRRFTAILLRAEVWLDRGLWMRQDKRARKTLRRPITEFARAALKERERKMRKLGERAAELSEAELHRLRIRAKNLRYAAEFFQNLFKKKLARPYIASVREIQDVLGTLNDAVVSHDLMAQLAARAADQKGLYRAVIRVDALATGWNLGRMEGDLARVPGVWRRHRACRKFWKA